MAKVVRNGWENVPKYLQNAMLHNFGTVLQHFCSPTTFYPSYIWAMLEENDRRMPKFYDLEFFLSHFIVNV
jgi:hypothetical protein